MNLVERVKESLYDVEFERAELPYPMHAVGGMCGWKARLLVNALCRPPICGYLEVGVLHGAMFCAAGYGNSVVMAGVDNFSQFGATAAHFRANLEHWAGDTCRPYLFEGDMLEQVPDVAALRDREVPGGFQVFFYDAVHAEELTVAALTAYLPVLADRFILLVDDYTHWVESAETQRAVERFLVANGLWTPWQRVLLPQHDGDAETWWNGMFIAVVEKGR